jgi:hypothetical protein
MQDNGAMFMRMKGNYKELPAAGWERVMALLQDISTVRNTG